MTQYPLSLVTHKPDEWIGSGWDMANALENYSVDANKNYRNEGL